MLHPVTHIVSILKNVSVIKINMINITNIGKDLPIKCTGSNSKFTGSSF